VDLCRNSEGKDTISLSESFSVSLNNLRAFMFRHVYGSPEVLRIADMEKVDLIIRSLYTYYLEHPDEIPGIYKEIEREDGTHEAVKDSISGLTDRYALRLYDKLFVPHSWR
jgi:dGTPase